MQVAPLPDNEAQRLESLHSYEVLDTLGTDAIDGLVKVASHICDTPIALVSLVDKDRQWFLSRVGLDAPETSRDVAFCSHAILDARILEVTDAMRDPRFKDNPLVQGDPNIRFYAGTPLINVDGVALGTLCVIDTKPRALTIAQSDALARLGRGVTQLMELHRTALRQARMTERLVQQDRMATTGTLAAGIGHEINNPLAFVMTNLDVAIEDLGDVLGPSTAPRLRDILAQLREAQDGMHRIRRIVRGLRNFAQAELTDGPCLVGPSVDVSIRMTRHEVERTATLITDLSPVPPVPVDDAGLTQVLVNLLINAAQAFETSEPAVNQIRIRTAIDDDNHVCIDVSDNGPGMSEAVQRRIFDPFFTTKPAGLGTGLGLAICERVIVGAGGELLCETQPGQGTRFRVRLPVAEPAIEGAEDDPVLPPTRSRRVLVIDDEPSIVRAVQRALGRTHHVEGTSDSREARARLSGDKPDIDVILCDIMMPHITGPELFDQVVSANPELADRFVFISGGVAYPAIEAFLNADGRRWIEKPFTAKELRAQVAAVDAHPPD